MLITNDRIKNLQGYVYPENVMKNPAIVKKKVKLSLQKIDNKFYLVNGSDEVLKKVKAENWGYGDVLTMEDDTLHIYENVEPNEGVLVYEPIKDAEIYWSDFVIGIYIYIESEQLGSIRINPHVRNKNQFFEQPLMFDDNTSKRYVDIVEYDNGD